MEAGEFAFDAPVWTWSTSVFPSNEAQTYVLPVKKDVRRRERLAEGDVVRVRMTLAE
ncbi:MAG: DUF1905 domain-containing protein [Candidatus Nanopelagicales bacterium]|jgi:hypothetical protein